MTEIEWRRKWKPSLTSIPWQPLNIDGEIYLIKCKFTQDSYELLVTDLSNFWYEELSENALKKRIQVTSFDIQSCKKCQGMECKIGIKLFVSLRFRFL